MKLIFEDVNDLDRERLLKATNGILKSLKIVNETKKQMTEFGMEDTWNEEFNITDDEIKEALCINQTIINYLKDSIE